MSGNLVFFGALLFCWNGLGAPEPACPPLATLAPDFGVERYYHSPRFSVASVGSQERQTQHWMTFYPEGMNSVAREIRDNLGSQTRLENAVTASGGRVVEKVISEPTVQLPRSLEARFGLLPREGTLARARVVQIEVEDAEGNRVPYGTRVEILNPSLYAVSPDAAPPSPPLWAIPAAIQRHLGI